MDLADFVWGQFVDLDEDGDADILHGLNWHENLDGRGTFSSARVIGRDASFGLISHPADIDGDGDPDIVAASYHGDLSWYENTAFGPQHLIELEYDVYFDLLSADVDGDGDLDLVAARGDYGWPASIGWYENADGRGTFNSREELFSLDSVLSISISDIDVDGQFDVVVRGCNGITWYEQRIPGDVNDDGLFGSDDLVRVFAAGKYEDAVADNATFDEGDWDGDGDFTTSDIVFALQAQSFVVATES